MNDTRKKVRQLLDHHWQAVADRYTDRRPLDKISDDIKRIEDELVAIAGHSEADQRKAIALLRAWVAGCGDEAFSTKAQVKELLDVSADFLASQSAPSSE